MAKVTVKLDVAKIAHLEKIQEQALWQAAEAVHTDIVQAQVMPFDTGNLQNESTSVQRIDSTHVQIQTVAPYAKRLYYHPEYKFRKNNNPGAKGRWLASWIYGGGAHHKVFQEAFSRFYNALM